MQQINESKSFAQQAFDDLPFWMRQMMHDKVQKCLAADANEELELKEEEELAVFKKQEEAVC